MKTTSEVSTLALQYFQNGLYCSEALLRAFNEQYDLGLPENGYKMATGFGSGMGETGCACGAVTSCVMVLGLVAGRTHKGESEQLVYDAVKRLQHEFKVQYKSTCCRVLTREVIWGSKSHTQQCEDIVMTTAVITEKILLEELHEFLPRNGGKKIPKKMSLSNLKRRFHGIVNRCATGAK